MTAPDFQETRAVTERPRAFDGRSRSLDLGAARFADVASTPLVSHPERTRIRRDDRESLSIAMVWHGSVAMEHKRPRGHRPAPGRSR